MTTYSRLQGLPVQEIEAQIRRSWSSTPLAEGSLSRKQGKRFTLYEGPPSANGAPGLHHLMARTLKDIFCRYKTQQGYQVSRRAGWDTHGLPIELQVEKELGITKVDIGHSISIEAYNAQCRDTVLRYTAAWEAMTKKMGFWIDMKSAYRTCDASYIESVWWLLGQLYTRDLLYKGYSIQPYSPAAGTALSQHEINQPGCYKEVKDLAITAQFKLHGAENSYLLAWTTTPWTLPANNALAVNKDIRYLEVETCNRYTGQSLRVWLAEACLLRYFEPKGEGQPLQNYVLGSQQPLPYRILDRRIGSQLRGWKYVQLMPYVPASSPAFQVYCADFVTTDEGTGIVHIASTFGADDHRLCTAEHIPGIFVQNEKGHALPIVDQQGCFVSEIADFAGLPVKSFSAAHAAAPPTDLLIAKKLKAENKAFHVGAHLHNYPHCWRTDRPILYYPIHSWFVRTSAFREQLCALNEEIHWHPPSTGEGRFGNWLAQLEDWNISRSRFWGTPLPIWCNEDDTERVCIDSYAKLHTAVAKAIDAGLMKKPLPDDFDPHRPFVDNITLLGSGGQPLHRVPEVVDVWFDSGAMPYAQWHYPFDNKETFDQQFPADLIAEGVDQTRGWFFTMHAISGMVFGKVAYKRVLSSGLVLDKEGRKMSKRLSNAIDPIDVLDTYGSDATRWYFMTSASPWENLRCDVAGIATVQRTFFGTLTNIFDFFMLYAGLDGFLYGASPPLTVAARPLIDRWLLTRLQALQEQVTAAYETYTPREAGRSIQHFTIEALSNWYVRLNRKRFWQSQQDDSKRAAYETLHEALCLVVRLAAPIAPFITDFMYQALTKVVHGTKKIDSVHARSFPAAQYPRDLPLEASMSYAQRISSLVHAIRKRRRIKVRQPLPLLLIADTTAGRLQQQIVACQSFILQEVNIKELRFSTELPVSVKKSVRPHLRRLGPRYGKQLKDIQKALSMLSQEQIKDIETTKELQLPLHGDNIQLHINELLIDAESIQGWEVAKEHELTVAVDMQLNSTLIAEGLARELVNKIQHMRKDAGFEVQDKINISLQHAPKAVQEALQAHQGYICQETQAKQLQWLPEQDVLPGLTPLQLNEHQLHIQLKRLTPTPT